MGSLLLGLAWKWVCVWTNRNLVCKSCCQPNDWIHFKIPRKWQNVTLGFDSFECVTSRKTCGGQGNTTTKQFFNFVLCICFSLCNKTVNLNILCYCINLSKYLIKIYLKSWNPDFYPSFLLAETLILNSCCFWFNDSAGSVNIEFY